MASCIPPALLLLFFLPLSEAEPLGDYIKDYKKLDYDTNSVDWIHRKSVKENKNFLLEFDAYGRKFKLLLRKDLGVFTPDAKITNGDGSPLDIDKDGMVVGELVGEPGSYVYGSMQDGKFSGKIRGAFKTYYVEPAERYLNVKEEDFHSVIYPSENVINKGIYGDISEKMADIHDRTKRDVSHTRRKRATAAQKKRNSCTLAIYADHLFTQLYGSKNQAAFQLKEHVNAAQEIYMNAFNTSKLYSPDGINFRVKKMVIYDSSDVPDKYKADNLGIDPMLNIFSADADMNHKDVCEAFLFTDRDFEGGILGLAWIGKPGSLGGICTGASKPSYNTGIVTMKLYKRTCPPKVSEITFAHELGHGFGSQHDPDSKRCAPGGAKGNFIMYSKATSGDRENNNFFSECSLKMIVDNVDAKRSDSAYANCFVEPTTSICGNRIVEKPAEQCDCGDAKACMAEGNCCNPPGHAQECQLRNGIICSPSQGPCCSNQCTHAGSNTVCRNKTDCVNMGRCQGRSSLCPLQRAKDYKNEETECDESRKVCSKGQCSKSICIKYSLEECQCSNNKELCDICCKEPGKDNCQSARYLSQLPPKLHNLQKAPGAPCANMVGYCDVFHVCRRVNMNGPLKRLKETFFTVKGLKELVKEYWWAVLLGILAGVVLVGLMVHFCSRYTPSSNPIRESKKPAKKIPGRKKKPNQGDRNVRPTESEHQV